ncbi:hypothetical protein DSLASN_25510 [Desulfoluna limicola]|uniref:Transposase IS200-like domain-containing protein n=1 Tax=Desulfoluna limicola TaxID=2810562 RepID=A0ABN6F363_9BACT|nr:hypothetical protein [Desulfoluna limicola]BCS96919.1 hypothetical protein DSLASN_25510 [Desulfoluna limicola]
MVRTVKHHSAIYAVDVLGFAIMGNHFHLLVPVSPEAMIPDKKVRRRFRLLYGEDLELTKGVLDPYRNRFSSLST